MPVAFMIARQRSGTGALTNILHHHPEIKTLGEVFHDRYDERGKPHAYFEFVRTLFKTDPELTLPERADERFNAYINHLEKLYPGKTLLIDAKYRSLGHFNGAWHSVGEMPHMIRLIKQRKMPVVLLNRRNFLATWVSGRLADANRVWHARAGDKIEKHQIWINPEPLQSFLQQTAKETRIIQQAFKGYKAAARIEYGRMLKDNSTLTPKAASAIEGALGLKNPITGKTQLIKQAPASLRDSIKNYREIHNLLKDTQFSWMTTEKE